MDASASTEPIRGDEKLSGHDRAVMDALVKVLHNAARGHAEYGPIQEDRRGAHFEVRLQYGQVARVTVELDRYLDQRDPQGGGS